MSSEKLAAVFVPLLFKPRVEAIAMIRRDSDILTSLLQLMIEEHIDILSDTKVTQPSSKVINTNL